MVFSKLTKVEQAIILFFLWRVMKGEEDWFTGGLKQVSKIIGRHEKSVAKALTSLQSKGLFITRKEEKLLWIKHTIPDEELYPRIAFMSSSFSTPQAMQEHISNLRRINQELKNEKKALEEELENKKKRDAEINTIAQQITDEDLNELTDRILRVRTYANVNKSIDEIIQDELIWFSSMVFDKYSSDDEEIMRRENLLLELDEN